MKKIIKGKQKIDDKPFDFKGLSFDFFKVNCADNLAYYRQLEEVNLKNYCYR